MADVLIVGASVAGAATAIHLSRQGRSVLLIDRARGFRRKACGEGLFSAGVAELERLGILPDLLPQARVLTSLRLSIRGHTIEAPLGGMDCPVIGIERRVLNAALLNLARQSGVNVDLGVKATNLVERGGQFRGVVTDKGVSTARVIVAADGAGSRLRRLAGLNAPARQRRYGVSGHYVLPVAPLPRVEVHVRDGYEVYLTPVGDSLVNLAVLLGRQAARSLGGGLRDAYCEMAAQSGALPEGARLIEDPVASGPFPVVARRTWLNNLVLVGDAAGFYDGVTGEGLSLALVTARRCAGAVDRFLNGAGATAFEEYDQHRRRLSRNPRILGGVVLALAAHPSLGARAVANLAHHPETFAKLVSINQGERTLASLRPRDLLALFIGI